MKTREHLSLDGVLRRAWYSECEAYRYALLIQWDATRKPKCFIGLNPSTATELEDDPTIRRCIDYARRWDRGGLLMLNASAYRATDPKVMLAYKGDQIGPENTIAFLERMIVELETGPPVAAWGTGGKKLVPNAIMVRGGNPTSQLNRADELRVLMGPMDCLGFNADGTPVHPLYQRADAIPKPFNYQRAA